MTDLWPDLEQFNDKILDNNAIEILRGQARILSQKTKGKVKATFSKIDSSSNGIADSLIRSISEIRDGISEDELKGKTDANILYNFVRYKFEIYNDTYRFRVFTLNYRSIFPIQIEIDEGIREERGFYPTENINSDEELTKIVSSVFSSLKLQVIIRKLILGDK